MIKAVFPPLKMLFMHFETSFYDHSEYILGPKLVIFLFSALLQAHAVIQLSQNA